MPVIPRFLGVAPKLITGRDAIGSRSGWVAWFGYDNTDGPGIDIPVGPDNRFFPEPEDHGQPTHFAAAGSGRFAVPMPADAGSLTWILNGTRQTASAASARLLAVAPVTLAAGVDITVYQHAPDGVADAARLLSGYLHRITGYDFPVRLDEVPGGISLGVHGDYRGLHWPFTAEVFEPGFRFGKQDCIIATHGGTPPRITIAGATVEALRSAVWEFLHQLGYRQYFPGPVWEVVPRRPVIEGLHLDLYRRPAYLTRNLHLKAPWTGGDDPGSDGMDSMIATTYAWLERNQTVVRPDGKTESRSLIHWTPGDVAHARIIEHWTRCPPGHVGLCPHDDVAGDWIGQFSHIPCPPGPDGRVPPMGDPKLCVPAEVEVPGVGRLTTYDLARDWEAHDRDFSGRDFLTMGVADSGTWCCSGDGWSPSDRAVSLANAVARQRQAAQANEDRMVGLRAHQMWREAPTQPENSVERNLLIEIANSYPEEIDRLMHDWRLMDARLLGVRDAMMAHIDKPQGNVSEGVDAPVTGGLPSADWMMGRLARFHQSGARFYYGANPGDFWGNLGLTYWLTARTLLTGETIDGASAAHDFAERAFGDAAGSVRAYFAALDSALLPEGVAIGRMYRALAEALPLVRGDPVRRERLCELAVYPRYRELRRAYELLPPASRPGSAQARALAGFAYATRTMRMFDNFTVFEQFAMDAEAIKVDPLPEIGRPADHPPWRVWKARLDNYLESLVGRGAAAPENREVFGPGELRLAYHAPETMVPAAMPDWPALAALLPRASLLDVPIRHKGASHWYTWTDRNTTFSFTLTPQDAGRVRVRLWALPRGAPGVLAGEWEGPGSVTLRFHGLRPGCLHRIDVFPEPGSSRPLFAPEAGQRLVAIAGAGPDRPTHTFNRPWLFYVPRGTAVVGGALKRDGAGPPSARDVELHAWRHVAGGWSPVWATPRRIPWNVDHFRIPVDPPSDGQVWMFKETQWSLRNPVLLTVPPQVARWPDEFLLPASVVAADGLAPSG